MEMVYQNPVKSTCGRAVFDPPGIYLLHILQGVVAFLAGANLDHVHNDRKSIAASGRSGQLLPPATRSMYMANNGGVG